MAVDLTALSPDERPWRIDWFGDVSYKRLTRFHQPYIRVSISPVEGTKLHTSSFSTVPTIVEQQRDAWLPVSALPLLHIGDIWQSGRHKLTPNYWPLKIGGALIETAAATLVKAGVSDDNQFLIPFSEHPWHRSHTHSYCVQVESAEYRVLIPCAELLRFYFGSSGSLIQRLFHAPLSEQLLWRDKFYDPATCHLHLKLADALSPYAAEDIGRISLSKDAWESAASVFSSCLAATSRGVQAYPICTFPFKGTTRIDARGMPLSSRDSQDTFLVFQIRSCDHPFPFKSLSYDLGKYSLQRTSTSSADKPSSKSLQRRHQPSASSSSFSDKDPGKKKSTRRTSADVGTRFPDLLRKRVWKKSEDDNSTASVLLKHNDGRMELLSFGSPENSSDIRALEVCDLKEPRNTDTKTLRHPRWIRVGVEEAVVQLSLPIALISYKLLPSDQGSNLIQKLPLLVDENGVIEEQLLCTDIDGHTRTRYYCYIEISVEDNAIAEFGIIERSGSDNGPTAFKIDCRNPVNLVGDFLQSRSLTSASGVSNSANC